MDFKEFLIGMAIIESNDNKEGFSKFFFKFTDKDKNNGVDRQELKQLLKFCLDITKQEIGSQEQVIEQKQIFCDDIVCQVESKNELEVIEDDLELNGLKSKLNISKEINENIAVSHAAEQDENKWLEKAYAKLDEVVNEAFENFDNGKKGFLNEEEFCELFSNLESLNISFWKFLNI